MMIPMVGLVEANQGLAGILKVRKVGVDQGQVRVTVKAHLIVPMVEHNSLPLGRGVDKALENGLLSIMMNQTIHTVLVMTIVIEPTPYAHIHKETTCDKKKAKKSRCRREGGREGGPGEEKRHNKARRQEKSVVASVSTHTHKKNRNDSPAHKVRSLHAGVLKEHRGAELVGPLLCL